MKATLESKCNYFKNKMQSRKSIQMHFILLVNWVITSRIQFCSLQMIDQVEIRYSMLLICFECILDSRKIWSNLNRTNKCKYIWKLFRFECWIYGHDCKYLYRFAHFKYQQKQKICHSSLLVIHKVRRY